MLRSGKLLSVTALLALGASQVACNSHPVSLSSSAGVVEIQEKTNIEGSEEVDILWIIDNSGSMCQEQRILRNNFQSFIEKLNQTNLDFHIGITTTHMDANYPVEPIAIPAQLQSTPQPVPGFDQSCWYTPDGMGGLKDGLMGRERDLSPIRDSIAIAVDCMTTPDPNRFQFTDTQILCALQGQASCEIPGVCGGGLPACTAEALFPASNEYRNIPKVLRAADYKIGALLDIPRLTADFACMSLVGTRGFGVETGLIAAVEAVSPVNTGGPVDPIEGEVIVPSAPNHGLIRKNARFAAIFVTDENDCSHDGLRNIEAPAELRRPTSLSVSTSCGADVCEFFNHPSQEATSPLIPVETLSEQFLANLAASKGREDLGVAEVFVASIHGISKRFDAEIPAECQSGTTYVLPTCATVNGTAYTGDRYEAFLRTFEVGQFFPEPNESAPDAPLTGFMCAPGGDFGPAIEAIGGLIGRGSVSCVNDSVMPCEGPTDTSCPAFPYTGAPGSCIQLPNTGDNSRPEAPVPASYYCDSGIQVRAKLSSPLTPIENLTNSNYCVGGSVGDSNFSRGCVVDTQRYQWIPCPSGFPGMKLGWVNEIEATNALAGTELQIRYNSVSSENIEQ